MESNPTGSIVFHNDNITSKWPYYSCYIAELFQVRYWAVNNRYALFWENDLKAWNVEAKLMDDENAVAV